MIRIFQAYGATEWPTREMRSRGDLKYWCHAALKGELRALWVGVLVAVPSGAGVALSVLGGNAGSLVDILENRAKHTIRLARWELPSRPLFSPRR